MKGMHPHKVEPPAGSLTISGQYKGILNKIVSRSDYNIQARNISRGIILSKHKISDSVKENVGGKEGGKVSRPAKAVSILTISTGKADSIQLPFYLSKQIDSFYHEDKPAGKLILDANESAALDGIFMNRRKIVSATATKYPKFAWVEIPYFMDEHTYYIDPEDTDPRYLVAILNSSLMWFWYINGAKKALGKELWIDAETIKNAPLVQPDERMGNLIIRLSNEASNLKKARRGFLDIWKNYSEYMMSESVKLRDILKNDRSNSSGNKSDDCWTSETVFRSAADVRRKSYENLVIEPNYEKKSIVVYGQNKRGLLIGLFEIVFIKKELMLHVYCALNDPYAQQLKTLAGLLNTKIPILQPNPGNRTIEIVKAVSWDFVNYVSAEKLKPHDFRVFSNEQLSIPKDLFEIEKLLRETLEKIDLAVFILYGLSKKEAHTILNSLSLDTKYVNETLDRLSSIDPLNVVEELLPKKRAITEHEEEVCNHKHPI